MDGALLIDKPAGPTSHDVVYGVRRALPKGTKVGHAGTLDPFATGLLIVLTGRATRAQRFLMGLPKSYETVARLGWTSTTGDPEGELVHTGNVPPDPPVLATGRLMQRPPAYSAVKVDGRRAYERARAGETVELAEREVEVTRFEQLERDGERARFAIDCSSGTYVRSLIADLADAYCLELRRTAIGPFSVTEADPERPLGLLELLSPIMEVRTVDDADGAAIAHGRTIAGTAPEPVLVVDSDGVVAIAEQRDSGRLGAVVGFRG
ncbi:MAG TPA: tRNA pseudouridine(55) synthase TruB [Baekduia sp.]|nr:tRNA pseudouridine(55) synthase TruB [Baekduia sp.]